MYSIVRSLPLPHDITKLILEYSGGGAIPDMIHKYFKYPLSRLDFDEWLFPVYQYSIWGVNNQCYFSELSTECFADEDGGVSHVLEMDTCHDLDNIEWDMADNVSHQSAYNSVNQNYPTFSEEMNGLGICINVDLYWDGFGEFAYTNINLFD